MRDEHYHQRELMVRTLAERYGIRDQGVLQALRAVHRHEFVDEQYRREAYRDFALPIGCGQTISQPLVVARMTAMLLLESEHSVLEIGTGSGYQTAVLARLARVVISIERVAELGQQAIDRLSTMGLHNVKVQIFDGTIGWSQMAPYDRILVTAAAPRVPERLLEQLKEGGRLVVPEGGKELQRLVLYEKTATGEVRRQVGEPVTFVPLIGRQGWDPE